MGRLVKAFSKGDDGEHSVSDEAQFLREAGALAARIQQELQAEGGETGDGHSPTNPVMSVDSHPAVPPQSFAATAETRPLGRDVHLELDGQSAQLSETRAVDGVAQDGLRLFTGSDEVSPAPPEVSATNAGAEAIRQELMEELTQEQSRWTERHAMQVRSIEEQTRQLAQVDAEVELREQELDSRERELDARAREVAAKAETEVRSRISRDWKSTQQEMSRLASEVRVHADRASQYEAELAEVRREHAIELDGLRSQLSLHDDSRGDRARSVIDECDQRMAELSAQHAAWQAEQTRRREELARERLEQRDELRQHREVEQVELTSQREEFEKERDVTIVRLDRERREWNEKFGREQDELIDLKRAVESESTRVRADVAREKAEWESHQELMRTALREEQASAQELLNSRMTAADRLKEEHTANFDSLTKEFESERATWHRERGQEAAILQAERSELETEFDRQRAERSLIEAERQQLAADLERQRAEHDESLRESWRSHQASLQRAEQESTKRQRVLAENLQQQQNELAARMQQAEHQIRTARELSARQIAQDKERFSQTCATHEAELERARAELNVQRQQLEREKLDFADELARTREQTEQERLVIRNSLSQMDAQLRVAATSLLPGIAAAVASHDPVETLTLPAEVTELPPAEDVTAGDEVGASEASDENVDFNTTANSSIGDKASQEPGDETLTVSDVLDDVAESADSEDSNEVDASAWEPGKEATLVETTSSDLIRRFDAPAETGGVSGLERRPRIASHGVLAQATSDAMGAEIVYEDGDRQPEWVGTVATRAEESMSEAAAESHKDGRRQALETYRSKLNSLQDQLRQLSNSEADESGSDSAGDLSI
jgi:hypothetical protein